MPGRVRAGIASNRGGVGRAGRFLFHRADVFRLSTRPSGCKSGPDWTGTGRTFWRLYAALGSAIRRMVAKAAWIDPMGFKLNHPAAASTGSSQTVHLLAGLEGSNAAIPERLLPHAERAGGCPVPRWLAAAEPGRRRARLLEKSGPGCGTAG